MLGVPGAMKKEPRLREDVVLFCCTKGFGETGCRKAPSFYFFIICFKPFQISLIITTDPAVSSIFPHIAADSGVVSNTAVPT